MRRKLLVIGSEGFIGKACTRYFSKEWDVVRCDIHELTEENYFRWSDEESIANLFQLRQFDFCINASGSANVTFSFKHPDTDYKLNVSNVKLILSAIKELNPECGFINFSSAAVYGNPASLPIDESMQTAPLSPYGKNKLESERLLLECASVHNIKCASLRVFSAYGPGLKKQLFWDLYTKVQSAKTMVCLYGTGKESRDFIFIDDLLMAIQVIINNAELKGEVYNVASGEEVSIADAAGVFITALGEKTIVQFSGEEKKGDPLNWRADISKLKKLGFSPSVSLMAGLKKTAEDYLQTAVSK